MTTPSLPPTQPVIVGVGQLSDRPADDAQGRDPLQLMTAALRAAEADSGARLLADLQSIALVCHRSFPEITETPEKLARALGARPRFLTETALPSGDSPMLLLNEAANLIGAGEIDCAAVAGGEALRTDARRQARLAASPDQPGEKRDPIRERTRKTASALRLKYGLLTPSDIYPLYEHATRAAWGQTLAEAQAESGRIWADFSKIAADNPGAWLRTPLSAEHILTPRADNRPIAFPYTKLLVANSAVNQGAGILLTSLAKARALGIAAHKLIYVGCGAAAHENDDVLKRDSYGYSAGMAASLTHALSFNHLTTDDLDAVEFYSCFPCVPKMARRVIGWPLDKPMTVAGGLTFAGGPIGNYMTHAAVRMVQKLRDRGRHGLLFANGGYATHNHTLVLSRTPPAARFPQDFDCQADADRQRGPAPPLAERYRGPAIIETYTVVYDRQGSADYGTIIGRTPNGMRFLAAVPRTDDACLRFLTDGAREPVGTKGEAIAGPDDLTLWRR